EPGVVGDIEQPARPLSGTGHFTRKNRLIANDRREGRQTWQGNRDATFAFLEGTSPDEAAERRELVMKRDVLAEWNQMDLVVRGQHGTAGIDRQERVPDAVFRVSAAARCTGEQVAARRNSTGHDRESRRTGHDHEGWRSFRPDDRREVLQARPAAQ